jgi:hypothetical protein
MDSDEVDPEATLKGWFNTSTLPIVRALMV